jgi:hypothetical protein
MVGDTKRAGREKANLDTVCCTCKFLKTQKVDKQLAR